MTGRWQPDLCTFVYLCVCVLVYLCIYVFVFSFQSRNRKAKGEYSDDRQVALWTPQWEPGPSCQNGVSISIQWHEREVREVMAPLKGPARTKAQLAMMAPLVAPRGGLLPLLALFLVLLGGAGGSGGCPPQCKCLWRWAKQQCFKSRLSH